MDAAIKVKTNTKSNTEDLVFKASLATMGGISLIVGVWSLTCLFYTLFQNGAYSVFEGFIKSIAG